MAQNRSVYETYSKRNDVASFAGAISNVKSCAMLCRLYLQSKSSHK